LTSTVDPLGENFSCRAFFANPAPYHTCLGFVWQNGVMTALPTLGGNNGYAAGMNNRGQAVGWAEDTTYDPTCVAPQVLQFEAVIYGPERGRIQQLPPLRGDVDGAATAINDKGDVVGISGICDKAVGRFTAAHAVLWKNGKAIDLGNLGGIAWNTPAAINNQGTIAGFSDLPGDNNGVPNFHAFVWSKDTGIRDLGTLPGDVYSLAFGINDRGQVVGQSYSANFATSRAFIWQGGVMTDLNTLIPSNSPLSLLYANDINDRGEITGGACVRAACSTETPAFLAIPRHD
jgi:probable HAF family extracellular repeat protein